MKTTTKSTGAAAIIVAIISCVIGLLGSFGLIISGNIGEVSFIAAVSIFIFGLLVVCFKDRIESINLKELSAKMKTTDAMIAKETEPPISSFVEVEAFGTDDDTKLVINALGSTKYTWRYLQSITKETNLSLDTVTDKTNWLIKNKLATEAHGPDGKIYALSPKGRNLFNAINKIST